MKYEDAINTPQFCRNCLQDVKVELHLMDHNGPHYARAACPICAQYIDWVKKPENDAKRVKSKFSPRLGYCEICGRHFLGSKETFEIHHKIPIEEGGLDEELNILELCTPCHKMCHFLRRYMNFHLAHYYEAYNDQN